MEYKTVLFPSEAEFTEKKSRFIGSLMPVCSWEQAEEEIRKVKSRLKGAKHYAYAYVLREGNIKRFSDDGEPQGTAGTPMLEILERSGLYDVLVVGTRYFGGILLGVGGLVRAYSQCAKDAVGAAQTVIMEPCAEIEFDTDYNMYGGISRILPQYEAKILEENFGSVIKIRVVIREKDYEKFKLELIELSSGRIEPKILKKMYDFLKKQQENTKKTSI
ncbi:MAG: YigZ family protein [Oscillospiraceae bacterium]|nr:YigZ family protein [Oscillospiraceae bacterium]